MVYPQSEPPRPDVGRSNQDAVARPANVDKDLLERVLQETLTSVSIGPDELAALARLAQGHPSQPLSQAIARDLVEVIVRHRLPGLPLSPVQREAMLQQLAESLLDDPQSAQRLERLWSRLGEAAPS